MLKCFPDEGNYLKDLKYENILKILEDTPIDPNEAQDEIEGEEEKEKEKDKQDNDDDAMILFNSCLCSKE